MGDSLGPSGLSVVGYGLLRFPKMLTLKRVLPPFRFVVAKAAILGIAIMTRRALSLSTPRASRGRAPWGFGG